MFWLLKKKEGFGMLSCVIVMLVGMIFLSIFCEYIKVTIITSNLKDAYERAILTVASENYNEVYAGFREIKNIGGEYQGGPESGLDEAPEWVTLHDYGDVSEELMELLNLIDNDTFLYSNEDEYSISNFKIEVKDMLLTTRKYEVKGNAKISIPLYFANQKIYDIQMTIRVSTAYTPKY